MRSYTTDKVKKRTQIFMMNPEMYFEEYVYIFYSYCRDMNLRIGKLPLSG